MASRVPVITASHMIFARECSEVHTWWRFFREVAGYWEDKFMCLLETYDPSGKTGLNKKVGNYVKCMYKMYQNLA